MNTKKKIAIISTVPLMIFFFLKNHIKHLSKEYEVTIITNTKEKKYLSFLPKNVKVKNISFSRNIKVINDIVCLFRLIILFLYHRFHIVYSISPKTGLLSMVASKLTGVPIRINNFTGQQWVIYSGIKKNVIKAADKVTARLATINLIDSKSQRKFLIDKNIVGKSNSKVINQGSICGVDLNRFKPNKKNKIAIREELEISNKNLVFIYLGRVNKNKGIEQIAKAILKLLKSSYKITFLIVGPVEDDTVINIKKMFFNFQKSLKIIPFTLPLIKIFAS